MTDGYGGQPSWGPPPGGPPPQHNQPYYPPPQPYYQPPAQPQQYAQPILLAIEGTGAAKLGARMHPRTMIIGPDGMAYQAKNGAFRIGWPELRQVRITIAYHQNRTMLASSKTWRVRVVMDAADPGFPQRHPEIAGLCGRYGAEGEGAYGLPLGPVENMVGPLAQAFATFGGQIFGGVIDEGQVIGFHYL
jgi:hypothetical protein